MGVAALIQGGLLGADLVLGVVHEHGAGHVGEAGVEAACDQNVAVGQADGDRVRLETEIVRYLKDRKMNGWYMGLLTSLRDHRSLAKSYWRIKFWLLESPKK